MRVFLSWSGSRSRHVAARLREWLADVMPVVIEPWMSEADIVAGKRWGRELDAQLADSKFGVVCLTGSNQHAPWLLFEAGAIAKSVAEANVCPYLIDLDLKDLAPGPLTQFQGVRADVEGTWHLVRSLNAALAELAFEEGWLRKHFDKWWPELAHALAQLPAEVETTPTRRSVDDMLGEILQISRRLDTAEAPRVDLASIHDELDRIKSAVGALRQRQAAEGARIRKRPIRFWLEYQSESGGLSKLQVTIEPEHTVFDALTAVWYRLRHSDAALKPQPYTYLWDWVLVRGDGIALIAGGLIYNLPATTVFGSEFSWSAEPLDNPLLNSAEWLKVVRGEPQVW